MDPVKITIFGLSGLLLLWLLTLVAYGVFGYRMWQLFGLLRQGRYENRFDHLGQRLGHMIKHVLLQPRIFNERAIGLPHFLIFWGFMVYATCFNWGLVRGLFPFLPVPYPDEVKVVGWFLEIFSVLVLISLAVAVVRRLFFAPKHLHLSLDANLILGLIGLLMLSTVFGNAFRIVSEGGHTSAWTPFGSLLSKAFATMPTDSAHALANAMWWLHMIVVLFFLVYLPYSKHLHLLASPFNVFFSQSATRPVGDLNVLVLRKTSRPARRAGRNSPGSSCSAVSHVPSAGVATVRAPQPLPAVRSSRSRLFRRSRSTWSTWG